MAKKMNRKQMKKLEDTITPIFEHLRAQREANCPATYTVEYSLPKHPKNCCEAEEALPDMRPRLNLAAE